MENVHSDVRVLRVEGKFSLAVDKWAGKTKQNHTEYQLFVVRITLKLLLTVCTLIPINQLIFLIESEAHILLKTSFRKLMESKTLKFTSL